MSSPTPSPPAGRRAATKADHRWTGRLAAVEFDRDSANTLLLTRPHARVLGWPGQLGRLVLPSRSQVTWVAPNQAAALTFSTRARPRSGGARAAVYLAAVVSIAALWAKGLTVIGQDPLGAASALLFAALATHWVLAFITRAEVLRRGLAKSPRTAWWGEQLVVAPGHRREGLGGTAVEHLLTEAASRGVTVQAQTTNPDALRLYLAAGCHITAQGRHHVFARSSRLWVIST